MYLKKITNHLKYFPVLAKESSTKIIKIPKNTYSTNSSII